MTKICGGAPLDWHYVGCGTALVFEFSAHGLAFWRCPRCHNAHWWRV